MSKIIGELNAAGICGSMNTANMTGTIGNGIVKYDSSCILGNTMWSQKLQKNRNCRVQARRWKRMLRYRRYRIMRHRMIPASRYT